MNFKVKRRLTYVTITFMFIFSGVEYAVVFPTIWAYLKKLGARNEILLGLSMGAFSTSSMLVGPMVGKLFDRFHNAKAILIAVNVFEIIGSVMYFLAPSPWFVVMSRFICGIGSSGMSVVFADLSNSTPVDERTSIMATFQACSQIGLLIGPAFNLLLRELNFKIGHFVVDKLTAPGLFMAIIGIILEILFITIYFNLGTLYSKQKLVESLQHSYAREPGERSGAIVGYCSSEEAGPLSSNSINCTPEIDYAEGEMAGPLYDYGANNLIHVGVPGVIERTAELKDGHSVPHSLMRRHSHRLVSDSRSQDSDDMIEDAEIFMCESSGGTQNSRPCSQNSKDRDGIADKLSSNNTEDKVHSSSSTNIEPASQQLSNASSQWSHRLQSYTDEFLRDEVVVLLGLSFVAYFAQASLETIATPLTQRFYNFDDFENSLFFLAAGIEILLSFLLVKLLSRKLQDRVLILSGSLLMTFSLAWYLTFIPHLPHGDWASLPYFTIGIFTNLLGISFLAACCISLYSKLISKSNQGVGHGLRRAVVNAGMIFGPLWGGAAINLPVVLFSIPLAVVSCFTVLFCISFTRLNVNRQYGEICSVQTASSPYIDRQAGLNSTDEESTPLLYGTR